MGKAEILIFMIGLIIGCLITYILSNLISRSKNKNILKDNINQFIQILKNIKSDKTKFKSRVNNTIYIETNLSDYGDVGLVCLLDKKDSLDIDERAPGFMAIFKDGKCIYTSNPIDSDLVNEISKEIELKHNKDINDVVDILGFVFSKEDFEKSFNIKEIRNVIKKEESDIDEIVKKNKKRFNIDEILDKISKIGIDNLKEEEKQLLKNYNK
jgi:hypothetical protein